MGDRAPGRDAVRAAGRLRGGRRLPAGRRHPDAPAGRPVTRRPLVAAVGTAAAALAVRRLGRQSGATSAEVRGELPGDAIVDRPQWESTRATTIHAPPEEVWPWIVQMGFPAYRAGWYTPHWLDRLQWGIDERSSEEIRPELQTLRIGDRVPDSLDWSVYFTVA